MSEREKFEAWFYASKYAQVVNPSAGDVQRSWDPWRAAKSDSAAEIAALKAQLEEARKEKDARIQTLELLLEERDD